MLTNEERGSRSVVSAGGVAHGGRVMGDYRWCFQLRSAAGCHHKLHQRGMHRLLPHSGSWDRTAQQSSDTNEDGR